MDSWSRPSANSKVPAPLYLSGEDVPYCHTCGRIMSTKKTASNKKNSNVVKYCSDRCRNRKPGALDRKIEKTVASLLNGEEDSGLEQTLARTRAVKGDPRLIVTCDEIETVVFGSRFDPEKTHGRRKNRKSRAIGGNAEWKSVDMEDPKESDYDEDDSDEDSRSSTHSEVGGVRIRLPQDVAEENFSAMGGERGAKEKIVESEDDLAKRRAGAKRAEEREMVRRAVRRIVIFGVEVPRREGRVQKGKPEGGKALSKKQRKAETETEEVREEEKTTEIRKGEALMAGMVVEPSYAKGNWSVRWRD